MGLIGEAIPVGLFLLQLVEEENLGKSNVF